MCRAYRSFILIFLFHPSLFNYILPHFSNIFYNVNGTQACPPISGIESGDTSSVPSVPVAAGPIPAASATAGPPPHTSTAPIAKPPSDFVLHPQKAREFFGAEDELSLPLGDFLRKMDATENIYGEDTDMINKLSNNTSPHDKNCIQMEARLFATLSSSDVFKDLSKWVLDPINVNTYIRQLYVFCRGVRTPAKHKVLNTALVFFSKSYVKLEYIKKDLSDINVFVKAQYQPNSCSKNFRCLFSLMSKQGITYTLAKSFNGQGMYSLYLIYYVCILCILCQRQPAIYLSIYLYFHSLF
jgi:hypothetical protein